MPDSNNWGLDSEERPSVFWNVTAIIFKFFLVCSLLLGVFNALSPNFDDSGWNTFGCVLSAILAVVLLVLFILTAANMSSERHSAEGVSEEDHELLFIFGISSMCLISLLILNLTDPAMARQGAIMLKVLLAGGCFVSMQGMLFSDTLKVNFG